MAWNLPHAGELRRRLRFERLVAQAPVGGYPQGAWAPIICTATPPASPAAAAAAATRWGKVEPTRGGEATVAGRIQGEAAYDLWVRHDSLTSSLTSADRAVDAATGELFALKWVADPDGRRRWILAQAESGGRVDDDAG